jgi:hypothetical protein
LEKKSQKWHFEHDHFFCSKNKVKQLRHTIHGKTFARWLWDFPLPKHLLMEAGGLFNTKTLDINLF